MSQSLESLAAAVDAIAASHKNGAILLLEPDSASIRRLRESGVAEDILTKLLLEGFDTAARHFAGAPCARATWSSTQFALTGEREYLVRSAKALVAELIAHPDCGRLIWRAILTRVFPGDARRTLQCDPAYDLQQLASSAVVWVDPYSGNDWEESQRYPTTSILWSAD